MRQRSAINNNVNTELTYVQSYLLKVCENPKAPEKYFTKLGLSLIESCFAIHPRDQRWNPSGRGGKQPEV